MSSKNLFKIQTPEELKELSLDELLELAASIRHDIIQATSVNGGHIGASLCCNEIVIALHKVFTTPKDSFVFDVGHQAYTHKMLTGRRFQFYKLRKENGISGFTNRWESEHDAFGAGHASTAISSALGILEGKKLKNDDSHVVAIVGDGALTGGLTLEGLNNAGALKRNLIIVLNDNRMSIDPNVGALKESFENDPEAARKYFTLLGIDYWGPFDGHDLGNIIETFERAKRHAKPVVLHMLTQKGHGYEPAIKDKIRFHGCGPFDSETGNAIKSPNAKAKYQDLFAETLIELANRDSGIVAITAAMPSGTSLNKFQKVYPDRFYDIGLAEAHGVEFGAGMATQAGVKPFVCIYSTFLQRGYDQLIHDVALQNLPVRVCMDRGGLVGDDGATHQGVFDYAYLRSIPNFVVMAPKDEAELQHMLETMRVHDTGPISVRFPRGEVQGISLPEKLEALPIGVAEHLYGKDHGDVLILAIGDVVLGAVAAAKSLEEHHKVSATVINLRFAKPLDEKLIASLAPHFRAIVTVEEGVIKGGVGSSILELLADKTILKPVRTLGVPDRFVEHASQKRQRELCFIDAAGIQTACLELLEKANLLAKADGESAKLIRLRAG
jgi:1-deoxy-D-xylulose-5-phosphate synthase